MNLILKRLITTGYVKVSNLNKRKLEYLLTPQGFTAQARRSLNYIRQTIDRYQALDRELKKILLKIISEGYSKFYLSTDGDLSSLVCAFLTKEAPEPVTLEKDLKTADEDSVLITTDGEEASSNFPGKIINIHTALMNHRETGYQTPHDHSERHST